jgi:hypothetical protein
MASAYDDNAMPPPTPVAPPVQMATLGEGEGYATQSRGQKQSSAAHMTTPISRVVSVNNHVNDTSLLITTHAASSASAAAMLRAFNRFSFSLYDDNSDDGPSPKKDLSDFSRKKTDDDSVASGDDSADWEKEDDQMRHLLLAQAKADDALDEISDDDGPVNEVEEFMLISGEEEEEEEVRNDHPSPQEFETI